MKSDLRARIVAEFLGTAFLVAAVVGSGIMAERLSAGNIAFGSACEYHRHWRSARGLDTDIWTHIRRASESGGFPGGRDGRWFGLVFDASLHGRTDSRRSLWNASSPCHVWASAGIAVRPYSWRTSAILERVYCHFRTFVCDLGMFEVSDERRALCGRELHHCRLLVYVLDLLRQPCGIDRQMLE
jgi:hypothetical protein